MLFGIGETAHVHKETAHVHEYARKSFHFMVAKICNELSTKIKRTETFIDFVKLLKEHFS